MIPTDNSDTFDLELVQRNGNKLKLVCSYPTYKQFKEMSKAKKEMETIQDELAYFEKVEEIFIPYLVNKDEVFDSMTAVDLLQFKNSFLDEAVLSETEKKKLLLQSQQSIPTSGEKTPQSD